MAHSTKHPPATRLGAILLDFWKDLIRELTDPYRPERYYMRGPGPKWLAKHATPGRPLTYSEVQNSC
jgi:hypothetical protein